jgi:hypothetical protein
MDGLRAGLFAPQTAPKSLSDESVVTLGRPHEAQLRTVLAPSAAIQCRRDLGQLARILPIIYPFG